VVYYPKLAWPMRVILWSVASVTVCLYFRALKGKWLEIRTNVVHMCSVTVAQHAVSLFSSVFCCRAGSEYPNGYPVFGNSRGGFPLPSLRFVIRDCDRSYPSHRHCLSTAPTLSSATLLSILEGVPLSATWGRGWTL